MMAEIETINATVAQQVEQGIEDSRVGGSIPSSSTNTNGKN